jgi:hypothetical protein
MKAILPWLGLLLFCSCSENNESDIRADYESIRVNQITLSDNSGKPVVTLSASSGANGVPILVVRDPRGAMLRTIELTGER